MRNTLFSILICILSFSAYAAGEKDFVERLNRLKVLLNVEFSPDLSYQNKVIGLKNLDDLINNNGSSVYVFFGRDKIVKSVIINDQDYDSVLDLGLRGHTLYYKYDGSYNESLVGYKLSAFAEELRGVSVMQGQLNLLHKNIKFVRSGNYQLPSKNNLYVMFLYEISTIIKEILASDLANKFGELDEIVITDKQEPVARTNMVYEEYKSFTNPQKIVKTLSINFMVGYYSSSIDNLNAYLKSLMDIMFKYEFKTLYLLEHNDSLAIAGVLNLALILNQNPQYVSTLKSKSVKSFYLNSMWNEIGDIMSADGMLTVGISYDDIRKAIDLFLL